MQSTRVVSGALVDQRVSVQLARGGAALTMALLEGDLVALEDENASDVRLAFAYRVPVGTQELRLPLMQVAPGEAICLLMTSDEDIEAMRQLSAELAAILPQDVEAVASAATLGIQVGACVAQSLGLPRQYVLQKTDKKHLSDALIGPLSSITTAKAQMLRLDRRWIAHLRGKRVAFVDDVVSTGGSCVAALSLLRAAGAHVVAVGTILVEGNSWRSKLGEDQHIVKYLAQVPIFKHNAGTWKAVWE